MVKSAKSSDGILSLGRGKWRARITYSDPLTGKKRDTDRIIEAHTKAEALVAREKIRERLGQFTNGDEWTFAEAAAEWIAAQPYNTAMSRRTHARRLTEAFGRRLLSEVTGPELQRWIDAVPTGDKTANLHRASLNSIYKFARRKLRTSGPTPPTVKRVKQRTPAQKLADLQAKRKAPPKALLGEDLKLVFDRLEQKEPDLYALLRTQLLLGSRWAEASVLMWDAVDWNTGAVLILQSQARNGELTPPKGGSERQCALGPQGLAFLRGHRARMEAAKYPGWEEWCFPCPPDIAIKRQTEHTPHVWRYEAVRLRLRDAIDSCGVEVARLTHSLRHAFVTLSAGIESDAKLEFIGHSSQSINEGYMGSSGRVLRAVGYAAQMETRINGGAFGGANVVQISDSPKK